METGDGYQEGWPEEQGWFDCKVNGVETRLNHWVCELSGRHEWINEEGYYIRERVIWRKS